MYRALSLTAVVLTLGLPACRDADPPFNPSSSFERTTASVISDGAHGGNDHFFFLPPLVPDPGATGTFNGGLTPTVEVCQWAGGVCEASIATYDMTTGNSSEMVRLSIADEHYIVNWHTDEFELDTSLSYRIIILVAGTDLGHADVDFVSGGSQLRNTKTGESIVLKDGRTLVIKFRIEEDAVQVIDQTGGTFSELGGDVIVTVSPGTVSDPIGFTVDPATTFPSNADVLPNSVASFGPHGISFSPSVTVTMSYDPTQIPAGGTEDALVLGHVIDGVWVDVAESAADPRNNTVTAHVSSFSILGVKLASPEVLPDNLIFASDRDGDFDIYQYANGSTFGDLPLTPGNTSNDGGPALVIANPVRIVFHSDRSGSFDIWNADLQGGGPTNLTMTPATDEFEPAVSPDGQRIAYVRHMGGGDYDIWIMNADGSGQTNVTNDPAFDAGAAWSPDGNSLAFHSDRNGNTEIYVMGADGSQPLRLTTDPVSQDAQPTWAPDGGRIAFAKIVGGQSGDIWVINTDGSLPANLTQSSTIDAAPSWSPDGSLIAYERFLDPTSSTADIYVMRADGTNQRPVILDGAANDRSPSWVQAAPLPPPPLPDLVVSLQGHRFDVITGDSILEITLALFDANNTMSSERFEWDATIDDLVLNEFLMDGPWGPPGGSCCGGSVDASGLFTLWVDSEDHFWTIDVLVDPRALVTEANESNNVLRITAKAAGDLPIEITTSVP